MSARAAPVYLRAAMALRFSLYYAAIFIVVGVLLPFWPAWLKFRGLSAAEIGIILSVGTWIRAFANPFLGHFADRTGAHRKMIMVAAGGGLAAYMSFWLADGFWPLFLINLVASSLFMTLIPLGENLASRASVQYGFDYGRTRLWGSITFILASFGAGAVVERLGDASILWMVIAALAASFVAGFWLPERRGRNVAPVKFPALVLLREKPFVVFMAAVSLLQASHATVYVFGTIHWRAAGIPEEVIGALWAEGVIAEIILFAFSGAVAARISPVKLMLLAAAAGLVRWTVLAHSTDIWALVGVQWMHGLTFGAAHLAAMHYMLRHVPEHMSASAHGLYAGLATGMIMGLMMLMIGWMYDTHAGGTFLAMTALSAAGGLAAIVLSRLSWRTEEDG